MTAPERPLHVRVAEALGCNIRRFHQSMVNIDFWHCDCKVGAYPTGEHGGNAGTFILRYDTDWSATGPLIERFHLCVEPYLDEWQAWDEHATFNAADKAPLRAVCFLLLALSEAGKLQGDQR